jgi:hypothetical protein
LSTCPDRIGQCGNSVGRGCIPVVVSTIVGYRNGARLTLVEGAIVVVTFATVVGGSGVRALIYSNVVVGAAFLRAVASPVHASTCTWSRRISTLIVALLIGPVTPEVGLVGVVPVSVLSVRVVRVARHELLLRVTSIVEHPGTKSLLAIDKVPTEIFKFILRFEQALQSWVILWRNTSHHVSYELSVSGVLSKGIALK